MQLHKPILLTSIALIAVIAIPADADAQSRRRSTTAKPGSVTTGVETGMAGVKLYDSALKLLDLYGNPDELVNLGGGGGGAAGPASRPGGGGRSGGGRAGGGAGGGANPGANESIRELDPYELGEPTSLEFFGGFGGFGGGGGGGGGQGGDNAGSATMASVGGPPRFTRWTYREPVSRYTFIVDKNLRIVQIEAVCGAVDPKVKSAKGIKFGSTFADVLRKYGNPDAFEIGGDTIVMRYLLRNKIAFRLNRLGPKQPHTVTAMVVSAGKA